MLAGNMERLQMSFFLLMLVQKLTVGTSTENIGIKKTVNELQFQGENSAT